MINGLEDYSKAKGGSKHLKRAIIRDYLAVEEDYNGFIKVLYEDIDEISYRFNKNPQYRSEDSEDRLNIEIADALSLIGYTTNHDGMNGGHVDINVELGEHSWIGEAKIFRGNNTLLEGFLQLETRYRPGSGNWKHNQGGLLIYIQEGKNVQSIIDSWKTYLEAAYEERGVKLTFTACPNNIFACHSTHNHEVSGREFVVRHVPFILIHAPSDKSGRNRKGTQ
ncbi:hypothetical protein [Chromobacterium violaceum]|uniref:hypothetical protein n=1 Tax=Chromobacterium violaceum TaxID=536 RepID=UPI00111C8788|nr:hypothetical protein [Chromobacterium violaceum]